MSWSIVGQNIARALIKKNHEVHLKSTNGYQYFPKDLEQYVKENLDKTYDMQISYTAMHNFPGLLANGDKNRFSIWNYESNIIPKHMIKNYIHVDKMMPSSTFAKDIFVSNGVPEDKLVVVPHGINIEEYSNTDIYELKTKKSKKILVNIAQPHIRKNLDGMFEAFGRAFTKDDDVCLVCKVNAKKFNTKSKSKNKKYVKNKRVERKLEEKNKEKSKDNVKISPFDVDFWKIYHEFCMKYPKHAEVEIITDFLPSMVPLYNACDVLFTMTRAECFYMPGLEAMAVPKNIINIAPNYGGQLDFMNEGNSLLIDCKEIRCPRVMQYWSASPYAKTSDPSIDHGAEQLQRAIKDYNSLVEKFKPGVEEQVKRLTWDNVVEQIIGLCE